MTASIRALTFLCALQENCGVAAIRRQQVTAVTGFQSGQIILKRAGQPQDFRRVRPQHVLLVVL